MGVTLVTLVTKPSSMTYERNERTLDEDGPDSINSFISSDSHDNAAFGAVIFGSRGSRGSQHSGICGISD